MSLGWPGRGSYPRPSALEASILLSLHHRGVSRKGRPNSRLKKATFRCFVLVMLFKNRNSLDSLLCVAVKKLTYTYNNSHKIEKIETFPWGIQTLKRDPVNNVRWNIGVQTKITVNFLKKIVQTVGWRMVSALVCQQRICITHYIISQFYKYISTFKEKLLYGHIPGKWWYP